MLIWLVIIAAGSFVAFGVYLYLVQDRFVFFPTRELVVTPDQVGLTYEDVWIEVKSEQRIHGWFFPAADSVKPGERPSVLFCHGNGGNISHRLETVTYLLEMGVNVFLFDYRGYGRSDGSPSERKIYEDAEAAYDWLVESKGIAPGHVFPFGRSLGGAVAIELAGRRTCGGLIVESSFTSAVAMAKKMFPFFPVKLVLRYDLNSREKIAGLSCPVLVTHSPDDDIVPFELGWGLYEAAGPPKRFVELRGSHNERAYFGDEVYRGALEELFRGEAVTW